MWNRPAEKVNFFYFAYLHTSIYQLERIFTLIPTHISVCWCDHYSPRYEGFSVEYQPGTTVA